MCVPPGRRSAASSASSCQPVAAVRAADAVENKRVGCVSDLGLWRRRRERDTRMEEREVREQRRGGLEASWGR